MSVSKYYDSISAMNVIASIITDPSLIEDSGKYIFREADFCNDFHRVLFGAIYNLVTMGGAKEINIATIEGYLSSREKSYAIYKANKGAEWILNAFKNSEIANFDYYYQRLKKFTLLRTYDDIGFDVSWIYDPDNFLDKKEQERQIENLDKMSLTEIADMIDNRISRVRELVVENDVDESCQIGDHLEELAEMLRTNPVNGNPLFDPVLNAVCMGARPGCFYLRSAATGVGKSRSAMADACYMACSEYYDVRQHKWVSLGKKTPTVYISVELDKEELQTMALAFVSGIPEGHIIQSDLTWNEMDRLEKAIQVLQESELYIEYFPNYGMKDIENCIKRNLRVHKTTTVFFDYITSSMKIIEDVSRASGGVKIREDQVLFLLSSKLKDIATTFGIFIFSSTQINGLAREAKVLDQNMLAGAKAIANRVDFGSIMVDVSPEEKEELKEMFPDDAIPNVKMSIYKNRRGEWNRVILWMFADKGTCRYTTVRVTDFGNNEIPISKILK